MRGIHLFAGIILGLVVSGCSDDVAPGAGQIGEADARTRLDRGTNSDLTDSASDGDIATGTGDSNDSPVMSLLPGEDCLSGVDCESGICLSDDGVDKGVCSEECAGWCRTGFDCYPLLGDDDEGAVAWRCLGEDYPYCQPCEEDTDCAADGEEGFCVETDNGMWCAPRCTDGGHCPSGAQCETFTRNDLDQFLCVPSDGTCEACPSGTDFYRDPENCGGCQLNCGAENGFAGCEAGLCGIAECVAGFADCNGEYEDGCETDVTQPQYCGTCTEVENDVGTPCGTCDTGRWSCTEEGTTECFGDLGDEVLNECGGCAVLSPALGTPCGECAGGSFVCDGEEDVVCSDSDSELTNACGGCGTLRAEPETSCGRCGSGTYVCQDDGSVECEGDLGEAAENECGTCISLPAAVDDSCGTCGSGEFVCDSGALACSGDLGEAALNSCGGCNTLANEPETSCGTCGTGEWACDGTDAVSCEGDQGEAAVNDCGGCDQLDDTLGDACGRCDLDRLYCDGLNSLACSGDTAANECGGCGDLPGFDGGACGTCGTGTYACTDDGTLRCDDDEGADALNGCGGCAPLQAVPETACGTCDSGTWACHENKESVTCEDDMGDDAVNDCGGCDTLTEAPGDACGKCDLDYLYCATLNTVECSGDTAGNACGGCDDLGAVVDAECGECADGVVTCDGTEAVDCVGDTDATDYWPDRDLDGTGDGWESDPVSSCTDVPGFVPNDDDCNDDLGDLEPGSDPVCVEGHIQICGDDTRYEIIDDCDVSGCLGDVCLDHTVPTGDECPADEACVSDNCSRGICAPPEFDYIPPGDFNMGSPGTEFQRRDEEVLHHVTLTHGFFMSRFEVSEADWRAEMGNANTSFKDCVGSEDCPINMVSLWSAIAYINSISGDTPCYELPPLENCSGNAAQGSLSCPGATVLTTAQNPYTCPGYRLPTEAEWEYAYRATTDTAFYNGDALGVSCNDANANLIARYCESSGDGPVAMGTLEPNIWGLYDMSGNLSEWVWEPNGDYPGGAVVDPHPGEVPTANNHHFVHRGGSWDSTVPSIRGAARARTPAGVPSVRIGFRVVMSAPIPDSN